MMFDSILTYVTTDTTLIIVAAVIIPAFYVNVLFAPTVK